MEYTISFTGTKRVRRKLILMGKRGSDPRQAMKMVGLYLMEITEKTFQSEGRRGGGSWQRLTPAYQRRKDKLVRPSKILHWSWRLRESLTEPGHPDMIFRVKKTGLDYGTKVPYAHRQAAVRPYPKMTKMDTVYMARIISRYIVEPFKRRGLG